MANGRIRRSARRGIAAAVLGWLGVAAVSVLMAPGASAAPSGTVRSTTHPAAASVDPGGTVTFVNAIEADTGGVSVRRWSAPARATVYSDVAVTFFGDERKLRPASRPPGPSRAATTGSITYTFRIVPQSGLAAPVADQVVAAGRGDAAAGCRWRCPTSSRRSRPTCRTCRA